jgi:ribonuclease HII
VTACAVILDPASIPKGLNDSKKLTAARRESLFHQISDCAEVFLAHVSVEEIDRINILQATMLAMRRAVAGLGRTPGYALIDGNRIPEGLPCEARAIIKGDGRSASIAAASIVAKVTRDALMAQLAEDFPGYGWETNSGYGTKLHQLGLQNLGVTPHHRRSFKPVHNILCQEKTSSP